jgi:hypothetical protein
MIDAVDSERRDSVHPMLGFRRACVDNGVVERRVELREE